MTGEPLPQPSPSRPWLGLAIASGVVLGTLGLTAPFVLARTPLPYMATPSVKIRRALEFLQTQPGHRSGKFVDLGSGDGQAVRQALQAGYRSAVGIELNSTLYLIAQGRRLFWAERNRASFVWGDLFGYSLASADTVFIFGVQPLMADISYKIARECQPSTMVLAYRFPLPVAHETDQLLVKAELIYDEDEMRIYRTQKSM